MSILGDLFKSPFGTKGPEPQQPGEWNRDLKSWAVIACDGNGNGAVLWWVGFSLCIEIEEAGLTDLSDLGLDDAPHGISIWEGKYHWQPGPWEHPDDGHLLPTGKFREPTPDEWEAIKAGRCPWDEKDWRVR